MRTRKKITKNKYEGLQIYTEETLKKEQEKAKEAVSNIPVKLDCTIKKMTPKNCKDGDIDDCPNRLLCGHCVNHDSILPLRYRVTEIREILDVKAYMAQSK